MTAATLSQREPFQVHFDPIRSHVGDLRSGVLVAILVGLVCLPAAVKAEATGLPSDRSALGSPPARPTPPSTEEKEPGLELPSASSVQGPRELPLEDWRPSSEQNRREKRMRLAASAFGLSGAMAGLATWSLLMSTWQAGSGMKTTWRTITLIFGSLSAIGLVSGTVLWLTTPKEQTQLGLQLGPGSLVLVLRY